MSSTTTQILKVAIYGQYHTGEALSYIHNLLKILANRNIKPVIESEFYTLICNEDFPEKHYETYSHYRDLNDAFDFMLTVGGDGTFLRAITFIRDLNIPILGINIGRLGFLATVQKDHIEEAIDDLISKNYEIDERSLLSVKTDRPNELGDLNFALNEITLSRKNTTSMVTIDTYLDKEYLTSYWADGLIIATPTGSTGYSLSCGGPILPPNTQSLVLTPIAPHNLNARPLVVPDGTHINLSTEAREDEVLLSLDSRTTSIESRSKITIKKADFSIKTVQLKDHTFFKTLREKLLWGEDKRN